MKTIEKQTPPIFEQFKWPIVPHLDTRDTSVQQHALHNDLCSLVGHHNLTVLRLSQDHDPDSGTPHLDNGGIHQVATHHQQDLL